MEKINIRKTKKDKFKLEKQILEKIDLDIFINLIIAIFVMAYFIFLSLGYINIKANILNVDLQVFCLVFLFTGIYIIEKAYKKDSGKISLYGIEILTFSFHTLTIEHFVKVYDLDFQVYVLTFAYLFAIYYVLKCIIIYTMAKRKYLANLSDIQEIVKKEPIKKEAKKRETKKEEEEEKTLEKDLKKKQPKKKNKKEVKRND